MPIDLAAFTASLTGENPPAGLSPALIALWWDNKGAWDTAHAAVDDKEDPDSMRVHAYLHRKEGARDNAAYWYGQAKCPMPPTSLEDERLSILSLLLTH